MSSNRQWKHAEIEEQNARDIYSLRFGTDGCLISSLEVLKTDRTFWTLLLTLAKTEMNDVQTWELDVIYNVSLF